MLPIKIELVQLGSFNFYKVNDCTFLSWEEAFRHYSILKAIRKHTKKKLKEIRNRKAA